MSIDETRRAVVAGVASVASSALLAGCAGLGDGPSGEPRRVRTLTDWGAEITSRYADEMSLTVELHGDEGRGERIRETVQFSADTVIEVPGDVTPPSTPFVLRLFNGDGERLIRRPVGKRGRYEIAVTSRTTAEVVTVVES